jgi:N-acetylneuraminic acid mutarotase
MTSSFAVTTTTSSISLDKNRQGQIAFTVSNTTVRTVRGRISAVGKPAQAGSWLSVQGQTERDFPGSSSQQYIVQLTVPASAPSGDYTVRLDVANVADPDDDFSEGPTVKFSVVAAAAPVKKPFSWWIVAVAVAVVIVLGGGTYGLIQLFRKTPTTPTIPPATPTPAILSQWSNTPLPLPTPRVEFAAVLGPDGSIYAFGGYSNGSILKSVDVYDPRVNKWNTTSVADMPTPRDSFAAVVGPNGRIYLFGGYTNGGILKSVDVYDPTKNTWSTGTVPDMPTPRARFAAVLGPDGRIYLLGGVSSTFGGVLNTVDVYDPVANKWSTIPVMPTPRYDFAAVVGPDGRIYALGGLNATNGSGLTTVDVYNLKTNRWSTGTVPDMPTPRAGFAAVVGPDGRIYALGSGIANGRGGVDAVKTVDAYDVKTNSWSPVPPMLTPHGVFAAVLGPDHRIYVLGGMSASGSALPTVEVGYGPGWK